MVEFHTVQAGNTLWGIAKKNGTSVAKLLELNPNLKNNPSLIHIGDKIILPEKGKSGMGTTVEHNPQQPADPQAARRRQNSHKKAVADMKATAEAAKKQQAAPRPSSPSSPAHKYDAQPTELKETVDLINEEIKKRGLRNIDITYWASRIENVSSQFDIPKEILVSIIGRETGFTKNVSSSNGSGAMQQTRIAISDIFPRARGNWSEIYKSIDEKLFNDIIYKKDANGNVLKDSSGKPIMKYRDARELHRACANDDELSIKVGALLFKMQYAKAIASSKYGRVTYTNVPKVIEQLKSGSISLTSNDKYIASAIQNYNGHPAHKYNYRRDVIDSLQRQQYDFNIPIIRA